MIKHSNERVTPDQTFETVRDWLAYGFKLHENSTALEFGTQKMSYAELDTFSNKFAHYLVNKGVKRGDRIGICMDRSFQMIVCVIAILKVGGAYVPLDVNYPQERLNMMQEDASLKLLISQSTYSDIFGSNSSAPMVIWEGMKKKLHSYPNSFTGPEVIGSDVAYVIFTSGSTGRPKGIEMPHRALANLINWQLCRSYYRKKARVLQYSSISFDVSFQEISTTLASGGTLILVKDEERRDPRKLLELLNNYEVERLFIPFVALRSMIEVANTTKSYPQALKEVITAGEQLRVDDGMRSFFSKLPGAVLENQYGPSETHVISAYKLDDDPENWPDLPPIGKAIQNNRILILNEKLEPVEQGQIGELYLSGINLAHGYIGREDLTQQSFILNTAIDESIIWYKTGDRGYYNKEGDIEFLGRADNQIKIRGHRVEPEEINLVGMSYPGVVQCFTHAPSGGKGNPVLVTYYVSKEDHNIDEDHFKLYLADNLPDYMVPSFVMNLKEIPFTPSGKVDLKSLPDPRVQLFNSREEVEYASDTEIKLAEIWSEVLGIGQIPRTTNFFDVGGDSLNAVTLIMRIEEQFKVAMPLSTLTQTSSIEELAARIDKGNEDINKSFRSLQVIQTGGDQKKPLFLVHGGEGNVLMFRNLALAFPQDQPVFAFQWSGWDGNKGEDDIIEMARSYKAELTEIYPEGPCLLGGYCIGGIIAIKMAEFLKAEGREVLDPLLVVDAPNLHSKNYYAEEPESSIETEKAFYQLTREFSSRLAEKGKPIAEQGIGHKDQKNYSERRFPFLAKYLPFYLLLGKLNKRILDTLQLLRIWIYPRISMSLPVKDRKRYCQLSQIAAVNKHEQQAYDGDVLYLKSKALRGKNLSIPGWWNDPFFGFEELCDGNFKAFVINENHNEVLSSKLSHQIIRQEMLSKNEEIH